MVNIHPSLLPKYPGLDTHRRAIEAGDAQAGCTVHLVTNDLDCGPILGQARVPVLPGDDEAKLSQRVLAEEAPALPGGAVGIDQARRSLIATTAVSVIATAVATHSPTSPK